jgi:hypothetical protein
VPQRSIIVTIPYQRDDGSEVKALFGYRSNMS